MGVAVFRATISGCYEPNPVERDLDSCRFSPLPDRNGRKLVDDRAERHAGRSLRIMTLQRAKASIRNPSKARRCRERPMCRSASGEKILADLFLCERRFIPPHQSLTRQTACSFLPTQGEAFCKSPFALHNKAMSGSNIVRPHQSPTATASPKGEAFLTLCEQGK